jgi:hypothetical protein
MTLERRVVMIPDVEQEHIVTNRLPRRTPSWLMVTECNRRLHGQSKSAGLAAKKQGGGPGAGRIYATCRTAAAEPCLEG